MLLAELGEQRDHQLANLLAALRRRDPHLLQQQLECPLEVAGLERIEKPRLRQMRDRAASPVGGQDGISEGYLVCNRALTSRSA